MATYLELYSLRANDDLLAKVVVAVVKKAQTLLDATPTAAQVGWAQRALNEPHDVAKAILFYVLAANSGMTLEQINGASDAGIQTAVGNAVDSLIVEPA